MDTAQKLGIIIFSGVPAIIGGGIVYALSGYRTIPVIIFEIILAIVVFRITNKKR